MSRNLWTITPSMVVAYLENETTKIILVTTKTTGIATDHVIMGDTMAVRRVDDMTGGVSLKCIAKYPHRQSFVTSWPDARRTETDKALVVYLYRSLDVLMEDSEKLSAYRPEGYKLHVNPAHESEVKQRRQARNALSSYSNS